MKSLTMKKLSKIEFAIDSKIGFKKSFFSINTFLLSLLIIFATNLELISQESHIQTAYNAIQNKNYKVAVESYNSAIQKTDNFAPAYYGRGLAFYYLGEYDKAINDFNRAIKLEPNYFEAIYAKGICLVNTGKVGDAAVHFTQTLDIVNAYPEAYYARGNANYLMKLYDKAILDYNKALELQPKFGLAYYGRAVCHKLLNNGKSALADFYKYKEISGNKDGLESEVNRLISEIENPQED